MNEAQIKARWADERPVYAAWGDYVRQTITNGIEVLGANPDVILKIPPNPRLKKEISLVDKALYRGKDYSDPYNDVEDKVGVRFVVLLLNELEQICGIISECADWTVEPCRHFREERLAEPLLFTYQSVHYVLRPQVEIEYGGVVIPETVTCEVQVRTLLQHAHAELTHDAIYKPNRIVHPTVHRTVAKSIALIETTDDFFEDVINQLNSGPLKEFGVLQRLDGLYKTLTGFESHTQKSALLLWEIYERFIDENLVDRIQSFVSDTPGIADIIKGRYAENVLCQQSTVLFLYWMLKKRRNRLIEAWPLPPALLQPLAADIGVSLQND